MLSLVFYVLSKCENHSENSGVFSGYFTFDFSEEELRQCLPSKVLGLRVRSAPTFTGPIHETQNISHHNFKKFTDGKRYFEIGPYKFSC